MKTPLFLGVAGTTFLLGAASTVAQDEKWYLDADSGVAIQQDVNDNGGKVKFDDGFRGGFALGYNFFDSLAAELETGVIWNSINNINATPMSAIGSADIYEIPMLANVIYKIPTQSGLTPYFGVGIGGAATMFKSSTVLAFPKSATDFTLAYQATAGLKYALGNNMELGVAYKFLGTTDHSWSQGGVTFKTDGTMTHSIVATFTWKF